MSSDILLPIQIVFMLIGFSSMGIFLIVGPYILLVTKFFKDREYSFIVCMMIIVCVVSVVLLLISVISLFVLSKVSIL